MNESLFQQFHLHAHITQRAVIGIPGYIDDLVDHFQAADYLSKTL